MISFGTSGWRGHLAYDFTFQGVACVTKAIAEVVKKGPNVANGVVIGRDPRFLTEKFARDAARILAAEGVAAHLIERDIPTPVISHAIIHNQLAGGINFTASHNPSDYSGMKYSMPSGGPALPQVTQEIARIANELLVNDWQPEFSDKYLIMDPLEDYYQAIERIVDFQLLAPYKYALNPVYGTARDVLDELLRRNQVSYDIVNDFRDPYFGGYPPEPAKENIQDFIDFIQPTHALGLMCDGDGDRFGILENTGEVLNPNDVATVLAWYLIGEKKMPGGTARSVATTHMLDKVARYFGRELYETPVGFKWLGELISNDKIAIGAEESAGLSVYGHVPEKDGILAVLLVAEAVAFYKKSFSEILQDIRNAVGTLICQRINLSLDGLDMTAIRSALDQDVQELGDVPVQSINRTEGVKFIVDSERWILVRLSGTEPVARVYAEAPSEAEVQRLLDVGKKYLLSK
ncbi:phosphoglucomutase/phosphomannomutase family protein [Desulfurispira natronophila]|uniref:Phosphoglucomutase n=1 Tax=Desulfurispira natronophila TaxID=682562 RepID=A0A7W7Y5S4_9BACT|nr:phosphoglucomutase/phosphomannomutase family protein [Desulfurispira natronophila]MBB5022615.1 phosphoglucomutase [Desulfurispira natronophila]